MDAHLKNRSGAEDRYSLSDIHVDDFVAPGRRRYGLWKPVQLTNQPELELPAGSYSLYTVTQTDIGRIDLIAWRHYQNVTWWWVIARFNGIVNPLTDMTAGDVLKIPSKAFVTERIEEALA